MDFPGGASGKEPACQCRNVRDAGSASGSGRSLGGEQPTPVFLAGESHCQRSLAGCHPLGHKESYTTEVTLHTHTSHCIFSWLNYSQICIITYFIDRY